MKFVFIHSCQHKKNVCQNEKFVLVVPALLIDKFLTFIAEDIFTCSKEIQKKMFTEIFACILCNIKYVIK